MALASRRCYWGMILLASTGLGLSIWLTVIHVRVHLDPLFESVCAFGKRFNCETVAASVHSIVAGIPISVIGMLFYLVVGILGIVALLDEKGRAHASLLAGLATGGALGSVVLDVLSVAVIEAVCLVCTATYVVNFALFACAIWKVRSLGGWRVCAGWEIRALRENKWPAVYMTALVVLVLLAGPGGGFPRYYELASWRQGVTLPHGRNEDGLPWIGAVHPQVVVHEYFDFTCPSCRLSHKKLRRLLFRHPDQLRIVRHDTSRAPCSSPDGRSQPWQCGSAKVGYCAGRSGRYWEWNDAFIAHPKPAAQFARMDYEWSLAGRLGFDLGALKKCVRAPSTVQYVHQKYLDARKVNVRATPTFIVNGKRLFLIQLWERLSK